MAKAQVLILAGGDGQRLKKSSGDLRSKAEFEIDGMPMHLRVRCSLEAAGFSNQLTIVGAEARQIAKAFPGIRIVRQPKPLGTGDAVKQCIGYLNDDDPVLVCNVDTSLVQPETYREIVGEFLRANSLAMVLATITPPDFLSWRSTFLQYGQVRKNAAGKIIGVTEGGITPGSETPGLALVVGVYVFDPIWLKTAIVALRPVKGRDGTYEYPITGLVEPAAREDKLGEYAVSPKEALGVNTKRDAEIAEMISRQRRQAEEFYENSPRSLRGTRKACSATCGA